MTDKYPVLTTELGPMWRRVDLYPPPKNERLLFRTLFGRLVEGVWYPESRWAFWCPMPKHSEEDKAWMKAQASSPAGQFVDGKPYEGQ